MSLTEKALRNASSLTVIVTLVVVFGLISVTKFPIQLFPDIEQPTISIHTNWRAASPMEIESELIEPQEKVLQGVPGLQELNANANRGFSEINLRFGLDTDMQKTLIDVISRMNRLPPLPRDATAPRISMGQGGGNGPALTYFFLQSLPGNDTPFIENVKFAQDVIRPAIEAVEGVASVDIRGGGNAEEELQIRFDPIKAAQYEIEIPDLARKVGGADDVSGGFVDVGRRQYTLRFSGRYSPDQLAELVLEWRDGQAVKLGDIAQISVSPQDNNSAVVQNGNPAFSIRVERESGANVLETLNKVKDVVAELNEQDLKSRGLAMVQSFDATVFIYRAINLVTSNLLLGIMLAIGVLWYFLRKMRATLIIAMAIPLSLLTTFIALKLGDRSLNVISLAGLAFASGMVLDAAIIVLENIVRLREQGQSNFDAAIEGTNQVWGALFASTATTVAIFIPVLFLKDVEGQLFGDLAITIAFAVIASLIVAVTILPVAASRWFHDKSIRDANANLWKRVTRGVMALTNTRLRRWIVAITLLTTPVAITIATLPDLDYLPPIKRDAVDAFFQLPPGSNIDYVREEIVDVIVKRLEPYMKGEKQPALKNYYILTSTAWGGSIGIRVKDQERVGELLDIVRRDVIVDLPDVRMFADQGNLFGSFGGGRQISVTLQSANSGALIEAAQQGRNLIEEAVPGAMVNVWPSTQLAEPELRLVPDDRQIHTVGWTRSDIGSIVRAMGDGLYVGEHFDGQKRMNIILRASDWSNPEQLADTPLVTPDGEIVQLGSLVSINRTTGPSRLLRVDRSRSIFLNVVPPENVSLEAALTTLKEKVEPSLRSNLPSDGNIRYGGSADSLERAIKSMGENFAIALVVLLLLISALFKSLRDGMLVMVVIPLATVGGVSAINLLNFITFQPLDLLTMIGFVILLGLVVNNAILLVHQTRSAEREGVGRHAAVEEALQLRLRPIFMSTLTSIFGMLPLLLMPGVGSVIYRGLSAVIVGGMIVSTLFTIVLLPCLLRMGKAKPAIATPEVIEPLSVDTAKTTP